jgi:hypothetical protein
VKQPVGLGDQPGVPGGAVLLLQPQQPALGAGARGAARVVDQQQREQAGGLAVGGQQHPEHAGEAERSLGQVVAHEITARVRRVPGRVQEMDHGEHRIDALRQLVGARHRERDAGGDDLLLRAREAGGHRRLGDEERVRDVGRRQPAHEP